jgi:glycerol-3-phosphate acyltransferase PlsY
MMVIFYLLFSYLVGSIPFGFLISKIFGKNILEIGWKKTSASNVMRNVGLIPGILAGLLDVGKGYFVVWLGQKFYFSPLVLILAAFLAVVGHNWSLYLKFAGGRGIGTFLGALIALSPKITLYSILFCLPFILFWNASIATILFLLSNLTLPHFLKEGNLVSLFTFISLFPIFLKRLSPIKEIFPLKEKKKLIRNRLLFDNDEWQGAKIKKFFQKYVH